MQPKLKIAFDDLECGWITLKISDGTETLTIIVSFTPEDSFLNLTNVLNNLLLYNGQAKVIWNCEPVECEMLFSRSDSDVKLEICEYPDFRRDNKPGEKNFTFSGKYTDICLSFWRALRNLQGRFSAEEFYAKWFRPFPSREMEQLTEGLKRACENDAASNK